MMRKGWRGWLGYAVLIAALPVAMLRAGSEANGYRAMGVDALDCDWPLGILLFAVPAVLIYAAGPILNLRRFRRRHSAVVGCLCGLICVPKRSTSRRRSARETAPISETAAVSRQSASAG